MLFRRMRRRTASQVRSLLGAEQIVAIDEGANFFGLESSGMSQIRGNGCLAATADEVLFLMWVPRKEIRIPRDRISLVERANSHLKKSMGRPLLRIQFADEQGAPDAAAWLVSDLPRWESTLLRP